MLRRVLQEVARYLPHRMIYGKDGSPYLSRYQLFNGGSKSVRIFLHHFHRGDEGRGLHDHPWDWAWSVILAGGYTEERLEAGFYPVNFMNNWMWAPPARDDIQATNYVHGACVARHEVLPGHFNRIDADTFHRVELREHDAWSLIVCGPPTKGWGFLDPHDGKYTQRSNHEEVKAGINEDRGPRGRFKAPERDLFSYTVLRVTDAALWAYGQAKVRI